MDSWIEQLPCTKVHIFANEGMDRWIEQLPCTKVQFFANEGMDSWYEQLFQVFFPRANLRFVEERKC